jgi:hypothetical protein
MRCFRGVIERKDMKPNSVLPILSLAGLLALIAGITVGLGALTYLSITASTLIVLITTTDYQMPRYHGGVCVLARTPRERMRLAA